MGSHTKLVEPQGSLGATPLLSNTAMLVTQNTPGTTQPLSSQHVEIIQFGCSRGSLTPQVPSLYLLCADAASPAP